MEGVSSHTNTEKSHTNVTSLLNTRDTMRKCETLKKEFRDHTIIRSDQRRGLKGSVSTVTSCKVGH